MTDFTEQIYPHVSAFFVVNIHLENRNATNILQAIPRIFYT